MADKLEKPPSASAEGYAHTGGSLWKVTLPEGGWRDVLLSKDPSSKYKKLVVISNNDFVSPRLPPSKQVNIWTEIYAIFGQNKGFTMLEVKDQVPGVNDSNLWPVVTYVQVEVVAPSQSPTKGASVTLTHRTLSRVINFGDYDWQVELVLKGADANTNGFIVQKVTISFTGSDGSGPKSESDTYWEAWRVVHGRVFSGLSKTVLSLGDSLSSTNTRGFRGTQSHSAEAQFMPNYTVPEGWATIPERAGKLPATRIVPPGWTSAGAARRSISVDFDSTTITPTLGKVTVIE